MLQTIANKLRASIGTAIVGKDAEIDRVIAALLCRGHVLLDDIPGTGKTTLARSLARSHPSRAAGRGRGSAPV